MNFFRNMFAIIILLNVTSCSNAMISGATIMGTAAIQKKSIGESFDDITILAKIKSDYLQEDINGLFHSVNVVVNEGRVLLTGIVDNNDLRTEAVRIAWESEGTKEVINEILVGIDASAKDYAKDTWITTQIRSKMLLSRVVRSINYKVITVNKVVYLMGVAYDRKELDEVTYIASRVPGVTKVISHVRVNKKK